MYVIIMYYDIITGSRDQMIVFGGMNDTIDLNDVWMLKPERKLAFIYWYIVVYLHVTTHRSCSQVSHMMRCRDHMSWLLST